MEGANDKFDEMLETSADHLLIHRLNARSLTRRLAQTYPSSPALELSFCLSTLASIIESNFTGTDYDQIAKDVWRIAALLSVDIFVMQEMGLSPASAKDLMSYWSSHDPFFLDGRDTDDATAKG